MEEVCKENSNTVWQPCTGTQQSLRSRGVAWSNLCLWKVKWARLFWVPWSLSSRQLDQWIESCSYLAWTTLKQTCAFGQQKLVGRVGWGWVCEAQERRTCRLHHFKTLWCNKGNSNILDGLGERNMLSTPNVKPVEDGTHFNLQTLFKDLSFVVINFQFCDEHTGFDRVYCLLCGGAGLLKLGSEARH